MTEKTSDASPRSISPNGTAQYAPSEGVTLTPGPDENKSGLPEVDLEYAATLKPSRVKGRRLMFMVTFVAGTGVRDPLCSYSQVADGLVYDVRVRSRCFEQSTHPRLLRRGFPRSRRQFQHIAEFHGRHM